MKPSPQYPLLSRSRVLLIACWMFLFAGFAMPALGETKSQITAVKVDADKGMVSISLKGEPGSVYANLLPKPNRLVVNLAATDVEKLRGKIKSSEWGLNEIRVGGENSKAKVVLDFGNNPVPAYSIKRDKGLVMVVLDDSQGTESTDRDSQAAITEKSATPPQVASTYDASEQTSTDKKSSLGQWIGAGLRPKDSKEKPDTVAESAPWGEPARATASEDNPAFQKEESTPKTEQVLAQATDSSQGDLRPPAPPPMRRIQPADKPDTARSQNSPPAGSSIPSQATSPPRVPVPNQTSTPAGSPFPRPRESARSPRQGNGPPITPPEPDPRLLMQELTELKFIQVGHNSRLYICGGDHLDYRLDRVSETKLKLDLINAEIPKKFQKALRTDLFATSVEMIVPGSQTIFIQLKEPAPYKVEKKKGVLTVDFSPPRFELTAEMKAAGKGATQGTNILAPGQGGSQGTRGPGATGGSAPPQDLTDCESSVECLKKRIEEHSEERERRLKYTLSPNSDVLNKPVTMDFQDIRLKNAFRLLSEQAGVNITLDPDVDGKTTLRLQNVPLKDIISTILITNDLASVMVGDVLRIGTKKKIKEFLDENRAALQALDQRIAADKSKIKSIEDRRFRDENPAALVGSATSREVGEAGCFKVNEEEICLHRTMVRLVYADPVEVVKVLDCIFNEKCSRGEPGAQTVQGQQDQRQKLLEQAKERLGDQGFTPDSPGGQDRMRAAEAQILDTQRTDLQAAGLDQRKTGATANGGPPTEYKSPITQAILQNNSLWPDVKFRGVFIKDTLDRIFQMKKVIWTLDVPTAQVMIESRIVQANKDWGRTLGVMWGGRNNQYGEVTKDGKRAYWGITGNQQSPLVAPGATGPANTATGSGIINDSQPGGTTALPPGGVPPLNIPSTYAVNLPAQAFNLVNPISNLMGLGMQFGLLGSKYVTELDARIQLGESTGNSKEISRPKVHVLDRTEAKILRGDEIPYGSTSQMAGTQVQFKDAVLELKVKPTIYSTGSIGMEISVKDDFPNLTLTTQYGVAITKREAKTTMNVMDGETAVIGGIIRDYDRNRKEGWPGLQNVPLVGYLFSNKKKEKLLDELFIFITPTIVKRPPDAS